MTFDFGNLPASNPKELDKIDPLEYETDASPLLEKPGVCYVRESVLALSRKFGLSRRRLFQGAALDIGAQKTVIGLQQAKAYCENVGIDMNLAPANATFIFGDHAHHSLGRMNIILPTPSGPKKISTHVVNARIPFLLGLDTMDKYRWNALTTDNVLQSVDDGWSMLMTRKFGHVFVVWTNRYTTGYTTQQLQKMHLHFMHPSKTKLLNLLQRAYPDKFTKDTKTILDNISRACHACQVYAPRPLTFKVRFPDDIIFNKRISLDLMYLHGKPLLHIVDLGTNYFAARFLAAEDARTVWNTFLYAWVTIYLGFPQEILTDQGSVFTSKEWEQRCKEAEVSIDTTGTESHNSLGKGETYHALLRRVYNKVNTSHPELPKELGLAMTVKAINDTAGPNGLVPTLLLFGVMPRIPHEPAVFPDNNARIKEMEAARKELEIIAAKARVRQSMTKKTPPAASIQLSPRQPVYVYRENRGSGLVLT